MLYSMDTFFEASLCRHTHTHSQHSPFFLCPLCRRQDEGRGCKVPAEAAGAFTRASVGTTTAPTTSASRLKLCWLSSCLHRIDVLPLSNAIRQAQATTWRRTRSSKRISVGSPTQHVSVIASVGLAFQLRNNSSDGSVAHDLYIHGAGRNPDGAATTIWWGVSESLPFHDVVLCFLWAFLAVDEC